MHNPIIRTCLAVACGMAIAATAEAQVTQADLHRNAATLNVGGDAFMMQYARAFYCNLPDNNNGIVIQARSWNNTTGANNNQYRFPLTQIFDDVWAIGNHYVVQYFMKTPDGFVELDSGNSATEYSRFNYPALQSLGMNASFPLKGIFLTHGHGDHDGGAQWALDNLGVRSTIGSADNQPPIGPVAGKSYKPNLIDSTDLSMRAMSIGGKNFWVLPTPGHTPGSTSAVLEVSDWGKTRRVLVNGGQSMTNAIPDVANYLHSIERTWTMADALNVEGVMTPHIYWDGEGAKLDEINATGRTNPGQHIYGHETVMRMIAVARECSAAWLANLDTTTVLPAWRFNTIAFTEGSPTVNNVSARMSNGWNDAANQKVTFSVAQTGASCTATTDADGVASCAIHPLRPFKDTVTVTFAGSESADFVDLPATASAAVCSNGTCTR